MHINYSLAKTHKPTSDEKHGILALWNEEYPAQLSHKNVDSLNAYLNGCKAQTHWFVRHKSGAICGWFMLFERNDEKWFAMIVNRTHQGKGLGNSLLTEVKKLELVLNGWAVDKDQYQKRDGSSYHAPLEFYLKNGFEVKPDVRFETDVLSSVKIVWTPGTKEA